MSSNKKAKDLIITNQNTEFLSKVLSKLTECHDQFTTRITEIQDEEKDLEPEKRKGLEITCSEFKQNFFEPGELTHFNRVLRDKIENFEK